MEHLIEAIGRQVLDAGELMRDHPPVLQYGSSTRALTAMGRPGRTVGAKREPTRVLGLRRLRREPDAHDDAPGPGGEHGRSGSG